MMGGENVGFRSYQVRLGDASDGMTLELLEPWDVERFDFLERFLVRHGDGPHHLTFKVADLAATIDRVRTSGYTPVGISLADPRWKEAFLQPREAHGTVVQLAQAAATFPDFTAEFASTSGERPVHGLGVGGSGPPAGLVAGAARGGPVTTILRRVVMTTPSLDAALGFFAGLLGGSVESGSVESGSVESGSVEATRPGPARRPAPPSCGGPVAAGSGWRRTPAPPRASTGSSSRRPVHAASCSSRGRASSSRRSRRPAPDPAALIRRAIRARGSVVAVPVAGQRPRRRRRRGVRTRR